MEVIEANDLFLFKFRQVTFLSYKFEKSLVILCEIPSLSPLDVSR